MLPSTDVRYARGILIPYLPVPLIAKWYENYFLSLPRHAERTATAVSLDGITIRGACDYLYDYGKPREITRQAHRHLGSEIS